MKEPDEVTRGHLDRAAAAGVLLVEALDMLAYVLFGAVAAGVLGHGPLR